jgi:hypothetical protein
MPSAQQILDAINNTTTAVNNNTTAINNNTTAIGGKLDAVNAELATLDGQLNALNTSIQAVDADVQKVQQLLLWGFEQLITLGKYTNQALLQNDLQNDTMICALQQVAVNTCGIWNEAHIQTDLQKEIKAATRKLAFLFAATHTEALFALEQDEELRKKIEACCPPKPAVPVCAESPCPAPPQFDQQPPATQPPPKIATPIGTPTTN